MTGWLTTAAAAMVVAGVATLGSAARAQSVQVYDEGKVAQIFKSIGFGGRLGVSVRDIGDDDLKGGKSPAQGVIVEDVESDTPAQKAGIKNGDVIVEFDGERVRSTRQFTRLVQESPVSRPVPMAVMRDGQRVALNVERRADESFRYFDEIVRIPKKVTPPPSPKLDGLFSFGAGRLGISVQELSPQLAEYFGTKDGVLVSSVTENSNASRTGLKAGDVITAFDGESIKYTSDLVRRTNRLNSGDEFTLGVLRDKKAMTLKGKYERADQRRIITGRTIL
jgi:serine protease Do